MTSSEKTTPANGDSRRPLVLVADDDVEFLTTLCKALRRGGFDVEEARDGERLVHLLGTFAWRSVRPDVVITDVRMPGYSGTEVLAALQSVDLQVPVIVVSAFADDTTRRQAAMLGAVSFFAKPFKIEDLTEAIWRHVARHG